MGIFTDEDDASKTPRTDNIIGNLKGYLDTRIDLVRLEVQEKVKSAFVGTLHGVALAAIGLFFFLFLNIFIGLLLNEKLDSTYWGFGILAGFYLVLLIIFLVGVDKKAFQGLADKTLDNTIYKSDKRQA
ncbi:phage holin family protein [Microvirga sp. STR05]|uniref:Phage holin family protein n=2 Tax=Hymenobacter TaxID=89966 RepID=A0A7G7W796_9BACT|nr:MULTISPECIES: phage holin family protein [Hymenobacter]MBD2713537.1 phage holin family protein [Hymenobacter duratus]MBR7948439.1 phage holin family protein [Microvirga sp. STR05]QNH62239.1 phage holin family protein [Hymenobacter sediminicola]